MGLPQLPSELLDCITSYLDSAAFAAVRWTCREIYSKTAQEPADRIVNQQWLLQCQSLNALIRAAEDMSIQGKMQKLWQGTSDLNSFINQPERFRNGERDSLSLDPGTAWKTYVGFAQARISSWLKTAVVDSWLMRLARCPPFALSKSESGVQQDYRMGRSHNGEAYQTNAMSLGLLSGS